MPVDKVIDVILQQLRNDYDNLKCFHKAFAPQSINIHIYIYIYIIYIYIYEGVILINKSINLNEKNHCNINS